MTQHFAEFLLATVALAVFVAEVFPAWMKWMEGRP